MAFSNRNPLAGPSMLIISGSRVSLLKLTWSVLETVKNLCKRGVRTWGPQPSIDHETAGPVQTLWAERLGKEESCPLLAVRLICLDTHPNFWARNWGDFMTFVTYNVAIGGSPWGGRCGDREAGLGCIHLVKKMWVSRIGKWATERIAQPSQRNFGDSSSERSSSSIHCLF